MVVLSDRSWADLSPADTAALRAGTLTAVLDPVTGDAILGPITSGLGIQKIPEALVVDATGRVVRHLVGMAVVADRRNTLLCMETALKSGG